MKVKEPEIKSLTTAFDLKGGDVFVGEFKGIRGVFLVVNYRGRGDHADLYIVNVETGFEYENADRHFFKVLQVYPDATLHLEVSNEA